MPETHARVLDDLSEVDPSDWNQLAGGHPMLSHEFFHALHQSGCATTDSGWLPQFITLWDDAMINGNGGPRPRLRAAMPLYLKSHSYGEYVFDWAWADAYQRHGLAYTPVAGHPVPPVDRACWPPPTLSARSWCARRLPWRRMPRRCTSCSPSRGKPL